MPLSSLNFLLPLLVILTLILFLLQHSHLLMALLAIEAITLSITFFLMLTHATMMQNSPFFLLIILTLAACEASLSLAILVSMSRSFGSDLVTTLALNKC